MKDEEQARPIIDWDRVEGVFFDLDGTLWDHRAAADVAVVRWARYRGELFPPRQLVARWRRLELEHFNSYSMGMETIDEQCRGRIRGVLGSTLSDDEADQAFSEYLKLYRSLWTPYPDAVPALRRCRDAGLRVGIITNGHSSHQFEKITAMRLTQWIDSITTSSGVGVSKPAAAIFEAACRSLGIPPCAALMVGDDESADVDGARRADLQAVLLERSHFIPGHLYTLAMLEPPKTGRGAT